MTLAVQLLKGHTYEEYDALFDKANLNVYDINDSITLLIDLTVCNAGNITKSEYKSIWGELNNLNISNIPTEYKALIKEIAEAILKVPMCSNTLNQVKKLLHKVST